MARRLSRRTLAHYAAQELVNGLSAKTVSRRLVAYLIENRRVNELDTLMRDIKTALAERGHVIGSLTSAHELTAETVKEIEAYTKAKTGAQQVYLDPTVDEAVLGGIKLELPGRELDATVARKLTLLKTRYKKA